MLLYATCKYMHVWGATGLRCTDAVGLFRYMSTGSCQLDDRLVPDSIGTSTNFNANSPSQA